MEIPEENRQKYYRNVKYLQNAHDIKALFQMTPYYWRTPKESVEHLLSLSALTTRVSFHITIYRKEEA